MKLSTYIISLFLIVIFIVSACSTRPRNVLTEKEMVEIMQDMYISNSIINAKKTDLSEQEIKEALINGILEKHGFTQAQFDTSLVWYADNIELYSAIQDTVTARLQRRADWYSALNDQRYKYKLTGFETELPEFFYLNHAIPTFRFRIDSNKLKTYDFSTFNFSFNISRVDTSQHRLEAAMYYRYKDSTVIDKRKIISDTLFSFHKPPIEDSLLIEMNGYIHMIMATESMPKVFISHVRNKVALLEEEKGDSLLEPESINIELQAQPLELELESQTELQAQ